MNKHGTKTCQRAFGVKDLEPYVGCEARYDNGVLTLTRPDGSVAHQAARHQRLAPLVCAAVNLWNAAQGGGR